MSDTKLSLPEAAEAVADLFEGNPDTFLTDAYFQNAKGEVFLTGEGVTPDVACFCAVGGVALAAGVSILDARRFLAPHAGQSSPEYRNNQGRRSAINMLRKAAKEVL